MRAMTIAMVGLVACGDDGAGKDTREADAEIGETGDTGEMGETGDTSETRETGEPDGEVDEATVETTAAETSTTDTREVADVTGETLVGTTLEGITVSWPAALLLCNAWSEGADIEHEVAHQVMVALSPQVRSDLAFESLAGGSLDGIVVITGPFADDMRSASATTRVERYEVIAGEDYDALGAEVEHDLGPAGRLIESYSVARSTGQTEGVVVSEVGFEVTLSWAPAGSDTFARLEPCAVPEDLSLAIAVSSATGDKLGAQMLRFYETKDVFAGSYPVRLQESQVVLSDEPWRVHAVTDRWAQIYAAEHHNWAESTRLDFTRDLATYQQVVKPLAAGEPITGGAIKTVQLRNADRTTVTITRWAEDGTTSDVTLEGRAWLRVDEQHIARNVPECAGRTIGVLGYDDHRAQVVVCDDDGPLGKRIAAVVPVVWSVAPEAIGRIFDLIGTTADGWQLAIEESALFITPMDDAFVIDVLDVGGTSVANTYSELRPLVPREGGLDRGVRARGAGVAVDIARRWVAQGVGKSAIYAPEQMTLAWDDEAYTVMAWDRMTYVNTHHNWNDTLAATTTDGHVLHWSITYDFEGERGLVQQVWVVGPDGDEVLAPTVVEDY